LDIIGPCRAELRNQIIQTLELSSFVCRQSDKDAVATGIYHVIVVTRHNAPVQMDTNRSGEMLVTN